MKKKISLAGDLGSGKSTVSKILIESIGAEYYSTGAIVRSIAEKRGMSVTELNLYMETHPEIDREIDDGLRALSSVDKLLIIDSRMAWHFTEGTFKVYLSLDIETSAYRIMNANRQGEHEGSLEETVVATRARRESEKKRYMTQYGVDIKDLTNYDLVVDTSRVSPEEVAKIIVSAFQDRRYGDDSTSMAYISPLRLYYPDDECDMEEAASLSVALEEGREIPPVKLYHKDGEFYVAEGATSALAYSLSDISLVPAEIIKGEPSGVYVKMENSL
jgi:cytidylate kinase